MSEPSQLVIVNDFAHVNGGAAQVALGTAAALAKRGYGVTVLAAVGPVAPGLEGSGVRVVLTNQYDIRSDPARLRAAGQGLWNFYAAARMREVLLQYDPARTVVHIHGWTKALSSSVIHAASLQNFPVVFTLHDYFYACPNGGFFNYQRMRICQLQPLSLVCLRENCDRNGYPQKLWRCLRQGLQNRLEFHTQRTRHFITLSETSEGVLKPFLPTNALVYRIPNPIDVAREAPVDVARNKQFISLGRLSIEKGPVLLAQAGRDLNCQLTFVGDGPSCNEITSICPLAQITGWQSREQVMDFLRSARALVFPSLWYEAQPLAVLEAAALGIPAIVPDVCAAREMVEPGVTGLWFRSGDAGDLRRKMAILQDPEIAAKLGRAAHERYWKNPLTMERHLGSLEACYRTILESCSVPHGPKSRLAPGKARLHESAALSVSADHTPE